MKLMDLDFTLDLTWDIPLLIWDFAQDFIAKAGDLQNNDKFFH